MFIRYLIAQMNNDIQYANFWSKILFKKAFEQQFVVPLPQPYAVDAAFSAIEKWFFPADVSSIKIDRPVFLVGLPRSGTTLIYNLLCAHPDSAYITNGMNSFPNAMRAFEKVRSTFNFNVRGERFFGDSIDSDFTSPSEPIMLWGKWFDRPIAQLSWPRVRGSDLEPSKVEEIQNDIKKVLSCFGAGQGRTPRFICKYVMFPTELRLLQDLFPDAKFVHIVRDARTTANSLLKLHRLCNEQAKKINHPTVQNLVPYPRLQKLPEYVARFGADDIRTTAHVWEDAIHEVEAVKSELKHFSEIRYEDLLKDPENRLRELFEFMEMKWPGDDFPPFREEFDRIGKTRHVNQYSGYDEVERIAGETMKRYGY